MNTTPATKHNSHCKIRRAWSLENGFEADHQCRTQSRCRCQCHKAQDSSVDFAECRRCGQTQQASLMRKRLCEDCQERNAAYRKLDR